MSVDVLRALRALDPYCLFESFTTNTAAVFMLHGIAPRKEADGTGALPVELLEAYLTYLHRHEYRVLALAEYVEALRTGRTTRKAVVFTADDGLQSFYQHGYPLFHRYGYPATVFLVSDFVERRQRLWWQQIQFAFASTARPYVDLPGQLGSREPLDSDAPRARLAARVIEHCKRLPNRDRLDLINRLVDALEVDCSGPPAGPCAPLSWTEIDEMQQHGIDFEPHTKTHPILSRMSHGDVLAELVESRRVIEARTGRTADIFCYPNGTAEDFSEETIACLREAGYRAAVTSIPGFDHTSGPTDLFRLRRFAIPVSFRVFKRCVSGVEVLKETLRARLR
jgi:peptidoglycan/xylan/chitin deacetylase (PgdA/CDA1 family)